MKKAKEFFDKHTKLSYLGNSIISLLGIIIFPYLFMPNFKGFILGLTLTIIVINILGLRWMPLLYKQKNNFIINKKGK